MRDLFSRAGARQRLLIPLLMVACLVTGAAAAQTLSLRGTQFYQDGKPWLPKGIDVEAFNRPLGTYESASMQQMARQGRDSWGNAELQAIKTVFGAEMIRLSISQPGLDPQSPIYTAVYHDEILAAIKQARAAGFIVIASMDAQAENGMPNLPCMPDASTLRAWKTLSPALANDPGVMLELFNEPCRANWDQGRKEWAGEMQTLITALRSLGAKNILLADGLGFAQSTNDLFPLLHDPLPDRLALAVHPYLDGLRKGPPTPPLSYFETHFGKDSGRYPLLATEWNATETNGCVDERTPAIALQLVRYLQSRHIGLIGWAIDSKYGKLVKDHLHDEPTDYRGFHGCATKGGAAGPSGAGSLIARFPNN